MLFASLFILPLSAQPWTLSITVSGDGTTNPAVGDHSYNDGEMVGVSATPGTGYEFSHWTGDVADDTQGSTTITMDDDKAIEAVFTKKVYTLNLSSSPSGASFTPGTSVPATHGEETFVSVTPPLGYRFDNWTTADPGNVSISTPASSSTGVRVTGEPAAMTANLIRQHQVTMQTSPAVLPGASVSPSGTFWVDHNVAQAIQVTVPGGYRFDGWTSSGGTVVFADASATSTTMTVTAGPTTVTANLVRVHQVTLQTSPSSVPGATLSPSTSFEADHNVSTAISVLDPDGYRFDGWSYTGGLVIFDNASSTSTNIRVLSGPTTITANFIQEHEVTLKSNPTPITGIVFTPSTSFLADDGVPVDISVNEPAGYQFVNWTSTGGPVSIGSNTSLSTSITVSGPATLTANFSELHTLTLLSDTPGAVFDPESPATLVKGVWTPVEVTPPAGYKFVRWEKTSGFVDIADENSPSTTMRLNFGNATVTATFVQVFTLTMISDPPGAMFAPASPAEAEISVPLDIAVANLDGYEFKEWTVSKGNATIANKNAQSTSVILTAGDAELTAHFLPVLSLSLVTDIAGVLFTPPSPIAVLQGELQSIFASTPEGYVFESWTEEIGSVDILNPASASTSVSLPDGDATLRANYALLEYTLNLVTDGTPGVTFTPPSPISVQHGVETAISVSVPEGFEFNRWERVFGTITIDDDTASTTTVIMEDGAATLRALFGKVLGVRDVKIPNAIMSIGSVVPVTLTVENDGGSPYTLISGDIGGYPLGSFQRLNATTYLANFTVTQGGNSYLAEEDIPVNNLIISDGTEFSTAYDQAIVQDSDELDAALPVILAMAAEAGDFKIGDVVTINIQADGDAYLADEALTLVNGIALSDDRVAFEDMGSGLYRLLYTVEEGDPSIAAGELKAKVVMIKPSGNIGAPYSVLAGAAGVTIDAKAPVLSQMELPDMEVGVGGIVLLTITADEPGYTIAPGTIINGIPQSSGNVVFTELGAGLYALAYTVSEGDQNVAPGNLQATVYVQDPAGNISEAFSTIDVNQLEVYTELPEAVMVGTPEICQGDEMELTVYLTGRPPFDVLISNGSSNTLYEEVEVTEFTLNVTPMVNTTYSIPLLTDKNGVENTGTGNVTVVVNERADVEITNLASGYNVEADPFILTATPPGGTFSGPGVNSATGQFDPGRADTINSPHTIKYTYVNESGCISVDSALVFVLGANGDIFIPSPTFCDYADPFLVSASNIAGVTGTFKLLNESGGAVGGLLDNRDNTATIDPSGLGSGVYTIEYAYVDEVVLFIRESFTVEALPEPVISQPVDTAFCQNHGLVTLRADAAGAVFTGPGVSGSVADGFVFDPSGLEPGSYKITCTVSSDFGCEKSSKMELDVLFTPKAEFALVSACLPVDGGSVQFRNLTKGKILVESWNWNFGDPTSGANNYSTDLEPDHFYRNAGQWNISLQAVTYDGCASTNARDISLSSQPVSDFTWTSDCFTSDVETEFINLSDAGSSAVDSVIWIFSEADGTLLDRLVSDMSVGSLGYSFPSADEYMASLVIRNAGGCKDTATMSLELKPTIVLADVSYEESFDQAQELWMPVSEDSKLSWTWGEPDFNGFVPVPGDNAWYTNLPDATPGYKERSGVQGPCFDFSGMKRPLIQLDIMRSFVPNTNGAVLQYMDVKDEGWKTIGNGPSGKNWYVPGKIENLPGGDSTGWSLEVFNPDNQWVTAAHDLDTLKGMKQAMLRIAFVSTGRQGMGNQGFAFDNIKLAEKTKMSVLEYFTNASDANSKTADVVVDTYAGENRSDVVDLQYHTAFPGDDPMNQNNPKPASNRSGNLLIGQVPYAVLDGGYIDDLRYDFSSVSHVPGSAELKALSLEIPLFSIELDAQWADDQLSLIADVTCETESYSENIQLYIVVFETLVTAYTGGNGDTEFRNVVLKMLPTPAGKLLGDNWVKGMSETFAAGWAYESYVEDKEDLAVAVFVQDRNSYQVLQAAVSYATPQVSVIDEQARLRELALYPNPVRDQLFVNLGTPSEERAKLTVMDLNGRRIMDMQLEPGNQIISLDVRDLPAGMYLLHMTEEGKASARGKFIKSR